MSRFFVYALVDPRNGAPFYIGKGCGNRPRKHLTESLERTDNVRKHYKIQSLRAEGVEPEIRKVREGLTDEEAFILEEAEILRYGRKNIEPNGILTNLTLGSRPPTRLGRPHSEETKQKMREAALGRKKSPEHCAAISRNKSGPNNHMWGKSVPEERKEKIRQGNLGKKRSDVVRKTWPTLMLFGMKLSVLRERKGS